VLELLRDEFLLADDVLDQSRQQVAVFLRREAATEQGRFDEDPDR
jgi:hypothetical protein